MAERVHDPIHKVSYEFHPDGENITVDTWAEPGGFLPLHFHPAQDEWWWVVDGETTFTIGGKKTTATPEDGKFHVPARVKHSIKNNSGREAHLRADAKPAMNLQRFLEEGAQAARDGRFTKQRLPKSLGDAIWMVQLLDRYGDDVVICSPPRLVQKIMLAPLRPFARRAASKAAVHGVD